MISFLCLFKKKRYISFTKIVDGALQIISYYKIMINILTSSGI